MQAHVIPALLVAFLLEVMVEDHGTVLETAADVTKEKKLHKSKKDKKHKHKHKSGQKRDKGEKAETGAAPDKAVKEHDAAQLTPEARLENGDKLSYDSAPESGEIPVAETAEQDVDGKEMQAGEAVVEAEGLPVPASSAIAGSARDAGVLGDAEDTRCVL